MEDHVVVLLGYLHHSANDVRPILKQAQQFGISRLE
jgi:hypothetical protein